TPDTVTLTFRELHGGMPMVVDRDIPPMQAASRALADVFDREPAFIREGGSIPVVAEFKEVLGIETVLMGFGLNADAIHSPNESFGLDRFRNGIQASVRFMRELAAR
ncbi:MAG: M20/M25/M40 family metallo-hydrolase, partial [Rhodothermales bacterium]